MLTAEIERYLFFGERAAAISADGERRLQNRNDERPKLLVHKVQGLERKRGLIV